MRSAIYYPHTEINDVEFLKTSLLLWDKVGLIVPFEGYRFDRSRREYAQAIDLLCEPVIPSDSQKSEAHDLVENFATGPLPSCFFYQSGGRNHYMTRGVWPQKFLPDTWEMLLDLQLTSSPLGNSDYPMQEEAALTIMSLLADCCAGEKFARITDRGASYAAMANLMGGDPNREQSSVYSDYAIVRVTVKMIQTSQISLGQIIHFRQQEEIESGHTLRDLRHRYCDGIVRHVNELKLLSRPEDRRELQRTFKLDMSDDLRALKQELRVGVRALSLTKDVMISTLGLAESAFAHAFLQHSPTIGGIATAAGLPVTIGGVALAYNKFFGDRIATLRKHPMAYLYELSKN